MLPHEGFRRSDLRLFYVRFYVPPKNLIRSTTLRGWQLSRCEYDAVVSMLMCRAKYLTSISDMLCWRHHVTKLCINVWKSAAMPSFRGCPGTYLRPISRGTGGDHPGPGTAKPSDPCALHSARIGTSSSTIRYSHFFLALLYTKVRIISLPKLNLRLFQEALILSTSIQIVFHFSTHALRQTLQAVWPCRLSRCVYP